MTPGWRRWAAILTTYTCLVAGAVPYRIRVPPPGQLVALSGDDLRVELDLPPPGSGIPLETPISPQRGQGEAGREDGGATVGGGRVRRDGELWIELVDMELEDERIRRKEEVEKKREEEEKRIRWRRDRREEKGEIGRREIAGEWNRVDIKGKIKEKQEKKSGSKRYGWVAGGVRPKGEKENVLKVEEKGDAGEKWREENRSGKWAAAEEGGIRRQKTEGKIWWKSWGGRGKGGAREGERRNEEGDGREEEGMGRKEEGSGETREEGEKSGEEGQKTEKGGERRRGLILESALVSRRWHDPQPEVHPPSHRGPSAPHSTLALTFPASHFTHGGLYVVRLVGTGRMVNSPGTQRPQRASPPGKEPEETQTRIAEPITRRITTEDRRNSSLEVNADNTQENQARNPIESEEEIREVNTQTSKISQRIQEMKPITQNPSSLLSEANDQEAALEKADSNSHMFSRIVETLENRFRWNDKHPEGRLSSSPSQPEGQKILPESARSPPAKRRKRESLNERNVNSREEKESLQISLDDAISRGVDVRKQKTGDGPRDEQENGPRGVGGGGEGRKRTCGDHSGISDYEKVPGKGQWSDGEKVALGKGCREGFEGRATESEDEEDRRKRRRREEWRSGEEGRISALRGNPESAFKTYLESKARGEDVRAGEAGGSGKEHGESLSARESDGSRVIDNDRKKRLEHLGSNLNPDQSSSETPPFDSKLPESTSQKSASRRESTHNEKEISKASGSKDASGTNTSSNRTVDGRVSRETVKACKGNCESTTRHILAEENVLVSWPTARFTLNILSSTPPSPSPFSTPTTTSKDGIPQNVTFGTFESPVKVVVEIPCGVGKMGGRSKRDVSMNKNLGEYEDDAVVSTQEDSNEGFAKDGRREVYPLPQTLKEEQANERDEGEVISRERKKMYEIKESYQGDGLRSLLKRAKSKGDREETKDPFWEEAKRNDFDRMRKGERNQASHWEASSVQPVPIKSGNLVTRKSALLREHADRVKVRKERVTKFDITDDVAESLSISAQKINRRGYSMKRETSKWREIISVERGNPEGPEKGVIVNGGSRRRRAARDIAQEETRNSIVGDVSRDPKSGLAPGPDFLPFRLFLVLRYCGPDSTECDEEEVNLDNIEGWKRPQTVYTEELADFPSCPNYRHQVILPCEVFGQAGVYMVQVRSNYTFNEEEKTGEEESELRDQEDVEKRRKRDEGLRAYTGGKRNNTDSRAVTRIDGTEVPTKRKKCLGPEGKGCEANAMDTQQSEERNPSHDTTTTETGADLTPIKSKGETANRHGYRETLVGNRGERDAFAWESADNWWEGSGDVEGDDGSGDWGDGWGEEGGRERRGGSGDGEYGDDPEGGEKLTSPQKFPDPPPRSLWSSSEEIHVHLSKGYVFTVHARSVFPCSDAHVKPETLEPAPSGVPVLFEYPQCILEGSDRVRVFGRARPDVAAILPPFWMGSDASVGAAATLSHPSLKYVAEKKIYKGKHTAWFDCSLFTERFSEYCFAYASEAMTGAVTHVRAQCIPTLPTSDEDRGGWGSWSSWSQCSTTCGSGSRNRYRTCDNPPPRYGAPFCEGTALETERCPPPSGVTFEELQEMCPLGLALSAGDGVNRRGSEPSCRCGGCIVHLQGMVGAWGTHNAGPIKARARVLASSSQACPGRSFWLLEAEPGHVVGLTVSSLLLPCPRRQWLKARDGDSLSSRLILHLPSSSNPASLPSNTETLCFSSGPHLLLEFYSFERLEPTCNGGFLAHAHQIMANASAAAIGKEILLVPTTRAVSRSSISVHVAALAFVLALVALSGGLALNYVLRRKRFNEELKKREKEEEEMSDSDSDTKCFIARNKDGGSITSVTSVSDVISLRKLSIGRDGRRREVHMRLREETEEDEDPDDDDCTTGETNGRKSAAANTDSNAPAKAICPKVVVIEPGSELVKKIGRVRELMGVAVGEEEGGDEGDSEEGDAEERKEGEVARRRRRKGAPGTTRREWRESACPLLEQETVAQSSISLPSSPTEPLGEDPITSPNAPGRPGLSASAPLLLRRSLSFFAAAASASTAGAASNSSSEGYGNSISAAGRQWWRKKLQRFQNGSVSPVREELEETWRLADPQAAKEDSMGKSKKPSAETTPAKECKEKQNRERLMRAGAVAYYPNPPSSTPSNSPSSTTSPEMGVRSVSGNRLRGRLRARVDERGKCTSEASLAGGASELDLEFDYYDYNVQNAGAAPGSYLGMDPAFLVYIPPFEGSTSPSSETSSASTLQAPPSEAGNDLCTASPPLQEGGGVKLRGEYYCINASYARANFQEAGGNGAGSGGVEEGSAGGAGELVSMAEFRRDSLEEGKGSEKETRVEKSPAPEEEEEEIKFADEEEEDEEEVEVEREKKEENKYGMIKMENLRLKKPI